MQSSTLTDKDIITGRHSGEIGRLIEDVRTVLSPRPQPRQLPSTPRLATPEGRLKDTILHSARTPRSSEKPHTIESAETYDIITLVAMPSYKDVVEFDRSLMRTQHNLWRESLGMKHMSMEDRSPAVYAKKASLKNRKPKPKSPKSPKSSKLRSSSPKPRKARRSNKIPPSSLPNFDNSSTIDRAELSRQLRSCLQTSFARMRDLLASWDTDGNGHIDKEEWRDALASLGYNVAPQYAQTLFDQLDLDRSGTLDYDERRKWLRVDFDDTQGEAQPPMDLVLPVASAPIQQQSRQQPRQQPSQRPPASQTSIAATQINVKRRDLHAKLCELMQENQTRVFDLFKRWDRNNDGHVDRDEMADALKELGINLLPSALNRIFESLDKNSNGKLELGELCDWLRFDDDEDSFKSQKSNSFKSSILQLSSNPTRALPTGAQQDSSSFRINDAVLTTTVLDPKTEAKSMAKSTRRTSWKDEQELPLEIKPWWSELPKLSLW